MKSVIITGATRGIGLALARFYDVDMNYISGLTRQKTPFPGETRERQ